MSVGFASQVCGEPIMAEDRPALSLVIPAYNEELRLADTVAQFVHYFDRAGRSYEVVIVDDGSVDMTLAIARDLSSTHACVRAIAAPHRGKGAAVRTGVLAARGHAIVFSDADLPVSPAEVDRLASRLGTSPVVVASREAATARRVDEPLLRHIMGRLFNALVRLVVLPDLQDTQCGVKGFTRASAAAVFSRACLDGFGFDVEVLYLARRLGFVVSEEPVTWSYRPLSRVDPWRDSIRMVSDLVRIRWNEYRQVYDLAASSESSAVSGAERCTFVRD